VQGLVGERASEWGTNAFSGPQRALYVSCGRGVFIETFFERINCALELLDQQV